MALPQNLQSMQKTLAEIVKARPDAITMHKGIAWSAWAPYAGIIPFILQSSLVRPDDSAMEQIATVEDAIRLGADAIAIVGYVRGGSETHYLHVIADCVREAARFDFPVICHIYPRKLPEATQITYTPEDIAWAVHCVSEMGVDIIKVPYCGEVKAYSQIVADCPVPVVAAGGPQAKTLEAALEMMTEVVQSGARGATIGRNVWGFQNISSAVNAFKSVIHDGRTAKEALKVVGL